MPDGALTLLGYIITAIIAPLAVEFVRRRRNAVDIDKVDAEADKIRAETRILEVQEIEARVKQLVDTATLGTSEIIEQQRGEIIELRNRTREQDLQISIMSETLNSLVAQVRLLELERDELKMQLESVNEANLKLIKRVEELEE